MSVLHFVTSLQSSGFAFAVQGDSLVINPASQLSGDERDYIRQHKPEILAFIAGKSPRQFGGEYPQPVEVWTPAGNRLLVEAKSPEHAADLRRWNPPPANTYDPSQPNHQAQETEQWTSLQTNQQTEYQ